MLPWIFVLHRIRAIFYSRYPGFELPFDECYLWNMWPRIWATLDFCYSGCLLPWICVAVDLCYHSFMFPWIYVTWFHWIPDLCHLYWILLRFMLPWIYVKLGLRYRWFALCWNYNTLGSFYTWLMLRYMCYALAFMVHGVDVTLDLRYLNTAAKKSPKQIYVTLNLSHLLSMLSFGYLFMDLSYLDFCCSGFILPFIYVFLGLRYPEFMSPLIYIALDSRCPRSVLPRIYVTPDLC